jgi:squalene-associated FAD-dependent desaturase
VEAAVSDVIVIGGGFAGIAAACRLAGDGHHPILLERAVRLGGRAASVHLRDPDETIDTGHHVSMRCCTATTGFLARIRASDALRFQSTLSIPIASTEGRAILRSSPLPGLFHLAPSLLRYPVLPARDRLRALRAGLAIALGGARTDVPFDAWLRGRGQSDDAIDRLWDPICVATLNAHASDVAAPAARKVFRDGFLPPGGADMGLFAAPLAGVFAAARSYVEERSGTVRTGAAVEALAIHEGRIGAVVLASGETIDADAVVCAVPPWDLAPLAGDVTALAPLVEAAAALRWAPIVNLHAWFDRPILETDFAVAVDSPVQAVFDVTRIHGTGDRPAATHVVLSQSAADEWIDRPFDDVSDGLLDALGELYPALRDAACLRSLVVRHRRATFVPAPGANRLRPRPFTPIGGLFLAGDWTATGWPSTIEGAIRSGIAAAAYAEEHIAGDTDDPAAPA